MKVLVTGCAGFIGSRVSALLSLSGHEVIGVDNLSDAYDVRMKQLRLDNLLDCNTFEWVNSDITNNQFVRALISKAKPNAVINLAARAGVRQSIDDPRVYYETNVIGTLNLLEACKEFRVNRFLLASTSSVYGNSSMPFSEDAHIEDLLSPYAASKKSAEDLCRLYWRLFDFDTTIFRFFTVYGPSGRPDMSIFRFVKWIFEEEAVQLNGDGTQRRDFTFVDDVARGVVESLDRHSGFEVINLGSDRPVEINQVINEIEMVVGKSAIIEQHPFPQTDMISTWANISRAKELLDWEPETSLEEGIIATVDWYRENRDFAKNIWL